MTSKIDQQWEQIDSGRKQPIDYYFPAADVAAGRREQEVPQYILKGMRKAIVEFDLLGPGDRILLGLSGGKDSLLLTFALSHLLGQLPWETKMEAIHIDLGLDQDYNSPAKENYAFLVESIADAGIPLHVQHIDMSRDILHNDEQSPCSRCAYWRRALIHNFARRRGFGKVAFAHHYDDAVETFLMGLLYSGQLGTFEPKTWLDKTGVTLIRPFVYIRERDIVGAVNKMGLRISPSPCPLDGYTQRERVKELIKELCRENPVVFSHLASAMREGKRRHLWPEVMERKELRQKNLEFWKPITGNDQKEDGTTGYPGGAE